MFERDLGDGWKALESQESGYPAGLNMMDTVTEDLAAWTENGCVRLTETAVPPRSLLAFLSAYREWSLQQPEGSLDRAEWEKAP